LPEAEVGLRGNDAGTVIDREADPQALRSISMD
jgi:hypothetical protein